MNIYVKRQFHSIIFEFWFSISNRVTISEQPESYTIIIDNFISS